MKDEQPEILREAARVAVERWIKWRDSPSETVFDADFEAWTDAMDDLAQALGAIGAQEEDE